MEIAQERFAALFLLLSLSLSAACRGGEPQASASRGREAGPSNLPVRQVKVANAESRQLTLTVTAPGTLAADEQATLSF